MNMSMTGSELVGVGTKRKLPSSPGNALPQSSGVSFAAASSSTNTASLANALSMGGGESGVSSLGATTQHEETISDVLEERLIDAEYKIWKKNTPYLYDMVMTHSLEWPSLTCQWLPVVKQPEGQPTEEHSLLLGTHTTGEQNYLMVGSVILPKSDANTVVKSGTANSNNGSGNSNPAVTPIANYDDERKEVGGFGFDNHSGTTHHGNNNNNTNTAGKIDVRMKVKHIGEINRARYMPQNHFIVATRGPDPELYIFDLSKHPSFPEQDSTFCPQAVCVGHAKEGYGMSWSTFNAGLLVSGSEDHTVRLWDVNRCVGDQAGTNNNSGSNNSDNQIRPSATFVGHTNVVEDVAWHGRDPNLIGSVGDDRSIFLWDVRKPGGSTTDQADAVAVHAVKDAHEGDINSIAFNPVNEYLFATGSADKTVALWDMRRLKTKLQTLVGHNDQVFQVSWAPFNECILASCSADRRVNIWDLSRIGDEQTPEDAEDGPPELLFVHGGHTSKVSDLSWNPNDEWTLSSVSEDNVLQVWNMAEEIYAGEDYGDDEDEDGDNEGKVMLSADDIES